jgi:D-3-phosphoglycerate dehydrogenase
VGGLTPGAIEHQAMETVAQVQKILQGEYPVGSVNAAHAFRIQRFARARDSVA